MLLSIVSCAIQQVLVIYLFYIQQCVYFNPKLLIYPLPFGNCKFVFFFIFIYLFGCAGSYLFIFMFIFGSVGSSLLCMGSPQLWQAGALFIAVCGPLTIAASPVVEHRLQTHRLSSCGSRDQLLRGMWDPPRPGLEPVSPASAGRSSTTAPPGKPL